MKLDDCDKVWTTTIKYTLGIGAILGFLWMIGPAKSEIEDVIFAEHTTEEVGSVAVQVCNNSACGGHGSGFHLYDGYFITAAHVTDNKKTMWIKASTGQQQEAKVLWQAVQSDFALMYVKEWDFLSLPNNKITCEKQAIGEHITITGYPASLGNITTKGIILGVKEDTIGIWEEPYIADITIFFGNSGGPAVNSKGEIFGIAVGALKGTNFSLIEDLSKICGILPLPHDTKIYHPPKQKEEGPDDNK